MQDVCSSTSLHDSATERSCERISLVPRLNRRKPPAVTESRTCVQSTAQPIPQAPPPRFARGAKQVIPGNASLPESKISLTVSRARPLTDLLILWLGSGIILAFLIGMTVLTAQGRLEWSTPEPAPRDPRLVLLE
ncbi:MAG: hypothetical protein J0M12_15400 [Deltaproteobacteria bacterium]|nr:hypothetical protein [Deltaproteobacteria bacterium]